MSFRDVMVIPEPKVVQARASSFDCSGALACGFGRKGSGAPATLELLCDDLHSLGLDVKADPCSLPDDLPVPAGRNVIFLFHRDNLGDLPRRLANVQNASASAIPAEGYVLDVDDDGIVLQADDDAGLFYAAQTLVQLVQQHSQAKTLPGMRIEDAPEFRVRGAQIDLSILAPTREAIEERLRLFSRYKINTVLMAYWDKFPFEKHPKASHPDALTKDDIRALVKLAGVLHIDLIPCIQCLGHVENVLANDEYAHLREDEHILSQFCPEHPGAFALFQDMVQEVMELHDSNYFHVGADEAYFLGHCPACREIAEEHGTIGVYVRYLSKVCDYIRGKGKTPIVWDDMLCRSPKHLEELSRDMVLYYWDYLPADNPNPFIFFRNDGWYCNKTHWQDKPWWGDDFQRSPRCRDIQQLPAKLMEAYGPYLSDDENHRHFHPYPFYQYYRDAGFETVACCTARGGEYGYLFPNYRRRISNIRQMAQLVSRQRGAGLLCTSWSEIQSPDEMTIYPMLAAAEYSWSPNGVSLEEFRAKFQQQVFGCDEQELLPAMDTLAQESPPLSYVVEERRWINECGAKAEQETFRELLDRRLEKYLQQAQPGELLADLNKKLTGVRNACAKLEHLDAKIHHGRTLYQHMLLAGRVSRHKYQQAILLLKAREALSRPDTLTPCDVVELLFSLKSLKAEALGLREENQRLLSQTYRPSGVRLRTAQMFEGELDKIEEYIQTLTLQSIMESNIHTPIPYQASTKGRSSTVSRASR